MDIIRGTMRTSNLTIPTLLLKIFPGGFLIRKFGEEVIERSVFELSFSHIIAWLIGKFCRVLIGSYAFIFSVLRIILYYNFLTHIGRVENCSQNLMI